MTFVLCFLVGERRCGGGEPCGLAFASTGHVFGRLGLYSKVNIHSVKLERAASFILANNINQTS